MQPIHHLRRHRWHKWTWESKRRCMSIYLGPLDETDSWLWIFGCVFRFTRSLWGELPQVCCFRPRFWGRFLEYFIKEDSLLEWMRFYHGHSILSFLGQYPWFFRLRSSCWHRRWLFFQGSPFTSSFWHAGYFLGWACWGSFPGAVRVAGWYWLFQWCCWRAGFLLKEAILTDWFCLGCSFCEEELRLAY